MTLDNILASLFVDPDRIKLDGNRLAGMGRVPGGSALHVLESTNRAPLGVGEAIELAAQVLAIAGVADTAPNLFLVDSSSQRMSRRDELLGLGEYLAHLATCLLLADAAGHRTIGLLYSGSAAGAFIATALPCGTLVTLSGAHPEVMNLPSMAHVTKLPLDVLKQRADTAPMWSVSRVGRANALTQRIERVAKSVPMRIDGELVTPAGRAVQGQEWRSEAGMLLEKGTGGVWLIEHDGVFA